MTDTEPEEYFNLTRNSTSRAPNEWLEWISDVYYSNLKTDMEMNPHLVYRLARELAQVGMEMLKRKKNDRKKPKSAADNIAT